MRTVIAGSRNFTNYTQMKELMNQVDWWITEVVSGGARGADKLGEMWAVDNEIPYESCLADWKKHGRSAGIIRNRQMANNAEALILFWDGVSRGSKNMLENASEKELKIKVFFI